ncbi:MAG: serine hydrolase domain-containing protein [Bacteroidota bacterium]
MEEKRFKEQKEEKATLRLLSVLFLLCCCFLAEAQDRLQLQKEIEKIIYYDTEIRLENKPGYIIGVIVGDSTFVYSYGSVSKDSVRLPDQHSLFEIGGITKVFTASLVELMAREQLIHYDSSLNSYLPAVFRNPACQSITIGQLIHHTSGLPRMPMEFGSLEKEDNNPYAHYSKRNLMAFYQAYVGPERAGHYLYSNLGYALLEIAIETILQQPFEEILQERLLSILDLKETSIRLSTEQKSRLVNGYAKSGKPTAPWLFKSFAASEGLKSSMADLLTFVRANLQYAEAPDWTALHQARHPTEITPQSFIGYGWHVIKNRKTYNVVLHPGSTSGYRALVGFVQETKTAVVVLSNSEYGTGGLGQLILRMLNNTKKNRKKRAAKN